MEATVLANATGFQVGRRGMYGPACAHVREMAQLLPADQMLDTGLVDYALGAAPHTGAFVIVHEESPLKKAQLAYYKLGDGPFYVFYTPFHLPHIQIASTIGRAVIHRRSDRRAPRGARLRGGDGRQARPRRPANASTASVDSARTGSSTTPRRRARMSGACRSVCRRDVSCDGTLRRTTSSRSTMWINPAAAWSRSSGTSRTNCGRHADGAAAHAFMRLRCRNVWPARVVMPNRSSGRPPRVPHRTYRLQGELALALAGEARSRGDRIRARAADGTEPVRTGGGRRRRPVHRRRHPRFPPAQVGVAECRPDVVIHMAAQSVVRRGYEDPIETYSSNVMGTVHLFEALRQLGQPCVVVNVTSDKCYENHEWVWGYRENDALGRPRPLLEQQGLRRAGHGGLSRFVLRAGDGGPITASPSRAPGPATSSAAAIGRGTSSFPTSCGPFLPAGRA